MNDDKEILSEEAIQMEEVLSQYYGETQEVISRYTQCTLCGGNLHFTHITDFSRNTTQETAKCPECGIRIRKVMHRLQ